MGPDVGSKVVEDDGGVAARGGEVEPWLEEPGAKGKEGTEEKETEKAK